MLRLPAFEFQRAASAREAARLLRQAGGEGMFLAGGTDLFPKMKRGQFAPRLLVGLEGTGGLAGVRRREDGTLVVGALTTLTDLSRNPDVRAAYPGLARAAGFVSTPALRNVGTFGGNLCVDTRCNYYDQTFPWRQALGFCLKLEGDVCSVAPGGRRCWAVSSSDTAPVAVAVGAQVRLVGPEGERVVPVEALYRDDGIAYLAKAPDEVLAEVLLPPPGDGLRTVYLKLRRRGSFDFPVLGVAAAVRLDPDGVVRDARLVLGACASRPLAVPEAGELVGSRLTDEAIAAVAEAAARRGHPLDNTDFPLGYRKRMIRVYVRRALAEVRGTPGGNAAT
jgi:4-hydroxybenzoyl-CoA reductase subunit beta